jgi:hypothetical protein
MRKLGNLQEDEKHPTTTEIKRPPAEFIHRAVSAVTFANLIIFTTNCTRPGLYSSEAETSEIFWKKEAGKYFVVQRQCARNVVIIVFVAILRGIHCC